VYECVCVFTDEHCIAQYLRKTNHCPLCCFMFSMASEKTRICLFGHSYIWRLQDFMTKNNEEYGNLGFEGNEVSLLSVGEGGATVGPGPKCIEHFIFSVIHFHPDIIYLHIGENDFRSTHHDHPSLVASRIFDLVRRLTDHVPEIFVSQLLSFPVAAEQRESIVQCNNCLKAAFQHTPTVQFWRHRGGFWNPPRNSLTQGCRRNLFDRRGVHLSHEGYIAYWRSVRVAVGKGRQRLSSR